MALPVSREQYAADVNTLKAQMATVKSATSVEQMVQLGVHVQETTAKLTHQLIMSITAIENQMATLQANVQATAAQTMPVERKRKSLAESKCIGNMKTLGSDKAEFRMWNERFINAIAQVLGILWRVYMRNLNRKLDQSRTVLTQEELNQIEGIKEINDTGNCDEASEGMYYVLVEKTEGDAALRVNSGEPGQGIQAYVRV